MKTWIGIFLSLVLLGSVSATTGRISTYGELEDAIVGFDGYPYQLQASMKASCLDVDGSYASGWYYPQFYTSSSGVSSATKYNCRIVHLERDGRFLRIGSHKVYSIDVVTTRDRSGGVEYSVPEWYPEYLLLGASTGVGLSNTVAALN